MGRRKHPFRRDSRRPSEGHPARDAAPRGLRWWIPPAAILLVGVLIYGGTLHHSFHFDDKSIRNDAAEGYFDAPGRLIAAEPNRFLAYWTFALNFRLHRLDPPGYHLVNIAIHLLNGWLVFLWLRASMGIPGVTPRIPPGRRDTTALLGALLFTAHPVQTQAVTYIVQRLASLATLWYLAACLLYLRARLRRSPWWGYLPTAVFFILGLFTKEIIYTLPVMLAVIEFGLLRDGRSRPRGLLPVLAGGGGLLVLFILCKFDLSVILRPRLTPSGEWVTPGSYFLTQLTNVPRYLRLLVWPLRQNVDYDIRLVHHWGHPRVLVGAVGLLAGLLLIRRLWPRYRLVGFGLLWMGVTIAIESSVIPLKDVFFEHRLYLPMVGFVLAAVTGGYVLLGGRRWAVYRTVGLLLAGAAAVLALRRNAVWKDDFTLWTDTIRKSPNKARPYYNLGNAYLKRKEYGQAIAQYDRTLELYPDLPMALINRGVAYQRSGDDARALQDFRRVVQIAPMHVNGRSQLGNFYLRRGRLDEALAQFDAILRMDPRNTNALLDRASVFIEQRRFEEALRDLDLAVRLGRREAFVYNNRGYVLFRLGRFVEALRDLRTAVRSDPGLTNARMNIGRIYRAQGRTREAVEVFDRILAEHPRDYKALSERGVTYAGRRQWNAALADFERALRIRPDAGELYYNRGITLGRMGRVREAQADFERARRLGFPVPRPPASRERKGP